MPDVHWQLPQPVELPPDFLAAVADFAKMPAPYAAQLLWQRGIQTPTAIGGFLDPAQYQPTDPFVFPEMKQAVDRIWQARSQQERVVIWGDFDADGITATAVLWEGLGQFIAPEQLSYFIPNRLTESHGLSIAQLQRLAAEGVTLIVTCDTGSTNLKELELAQRLGIEVIITDHHTLPADRPPVVALLNPRSFPAAHPLAQLSGVAVAYKLVEALYQQFPTVPTRSIESLLDLVAIGLIADLVQLTGDCRYLAQRGIAVLQQANQPDAQRPGLAQLLKLCKRTGDRPTDISFGLGPRINAISRIQGDARFCVELLTSQDRDRCRELAEATELANARRQALQRDVLQQVTAKLAQLDLSTTPAIVLSDPQWSVGILGLVAGQVAQTYGRPTLLLSTETAASPEFPPLEVAHSISPAAATVLPIGSTTVLPIASPTVSPAELPSPTVPPAVSSTVSPVNSSTVSPTVTPSTQSSHTPIARGSARSVNGIDLYELVKQQAHLLHSFGGHPLAMGLSLATDKIHLFTEAINRQLRQQGQEMRMPIVSADLIVTVAELGQRLFRELKLLEPCGMGNPAPKLLLQNVWFAKTWHQRIKDRRGQKLEFIKTEFELWDDAAESGFPGIWWGHYKDELPADRCDVVVELDFNSYEDDRRSKRYEVRLLAVRPANWESIAPPAALPEIWDWRSSIPLDRSVPVLELSHCPRSWAEWQAWLDRAALSRCPLALAYPPPLLPSPPLLWQQLIGIAKYLSRTGKLATRSQIQAKLDIGDRLLEAGLQALQPLGLLFTQIGENLSFRLSANDSFSSNFDSSDCQHPSLDRFFSLIQEEQFLRRYFSEASIATLIAASARMQLPEAIEISA